MDPLARAKALLEHSHQVERRCKERRGLGAKVPCPVCESWVSTVINRSLTQKAEGSYLRHRRCHTCDTEFETAERLTKVIKAGKRPA